MNTATPNPRRAFFEALTDKSSENSPSPVGRWLDGVLKSVDDSSMQAEFIVRADMTNPMGILHGGVAAMMMDEVCGMLVFSLGREYAYTSVNLNCDFLNRASIGEKLVCRAVVIREGRNIVHCEVSITNSTGVLVAKSATNLIQTGLKIPF